MSDFRQSTTFADEWLRLISDAAVDDFDRLGASDVDAVRDDSKLFLLSAFRFFDEAVPFLMLLLSTTETATNKPGLVLDPDEVSDRGEQSVDPLRIFR